MWYNKFGLLQKLRFCAKFIERLTLPLCGSAAYAAVEHCVFEGMV